MPSTLRTGLTLAVICLGAVSAANAKSCAVTKEFIVPHSQRLSGVFLDLNGAVLSGLKIDLSTHKTIFKSLRTNSDGAYDFGEIPAGKYKVRVRYGDSEPFCAPKIECSGQGCRIDSYISINPKNKYAVTVD